MVYAIFTFIALGIAGGYFFLGLEHKDLLDEILMSALYFMVLLPVSKSAETGIL
mgnify:CR=1 FL=1